MSTLPIQTSPCLILPFPVVHHVLSCTLPCPALSSSVLRVYQILSYYVPQPVMQVFHRYCKVIIQQSNNKSCNWGCDWFLSLPNSSIIGLTLCRQTGAYWLLQTVTGKQINIRKCITSVKLVWFLYNVEEYAASRSPFDSTGIFLILVTLALKGSVDAHVSLY